MKCPAGCGDMEITDALKGSKRARCPVCRTTSMIPKSQVEKVLHGTTEEPPRETHPAPESEPKPAAERTLGDHFWDWLNS